jgi:hypothetical protein
MVVGIFFEDSTRVDRISDDVYEDRTILYNGKRYSLIDNPMSYMLGFYNWIISDGELVGVNFRFMIKSPNLLEWIKKGNYENIRIDDTEVFIFFKQVNSFWIEYIEGFVELYLLSAVEDTFALTFLLPEDLDYDIPTDSLIGHLR